MKLWEKGTKLDERIEAYTVGNDHLIDARLVEYDCLASIAHAKMLGKIGILPADEVRTLKKALDEILARNHKGEFHIEPEQEDCHTAIEASLTQSLGDLGKKIHTARSRNDQVLTALRLYYKDALAAVGDNIDALVAAAGEFISKNGAVEFPGFTHTRKAMPSSFDMWGSAIIESMADNRRLLATTFEIIDQSPLGTGAGYGVSPIEIDREFTARELGFSRVQSSPVYTQLSRGKFEATILHVLSQIMLDLNRVATDLIFFSLPDLGYVELPPEICTGSSIMPQKQNPDVLELMRAKYHVVASYETQIRGFITNMISGYHRDLQLAKEPTFKGFDITIDSLAILAFVFGKLQVNPDNCRKAMTAELYATREAYELVKQGMPFRDAYQKVADKFR